MKTFKHKKTGWRAETHYCVPHSYEVKTGEGSGICIPAELIENSQDWQEVTKEPILTTEDGVELFEGDDSFWIRAINGTGRCIIHTGKIGKKRNPELVYFSAREAAEDYRLNNARVLSFKDVEKEFATAYIEDAMECLRNLAKSRL